MLDFAMQPWEGHTHAIRDDHRRYWFTLPAGSTPESAAHDFISSWYPGDDQPPTQVVVVVETWSDECTKAWDAGTDDWVHRVRGVCAVTGTSPAGDRVEAQGEAQG